jgi:hypothetical protein
VQGIDLWRKRLLRLLVHVAGEGVGDLSCKVRSVGFHAPRLPDEGPRGGVLVMAVSSGLKSLNEVLGLAARKDAKRARASAASGNTLVMRCMPWATVKRLRSSA